MGSGVSIKRHFSRFFWAYLLAGAFSVSLWSWVIPAKTKPKANETVGVFIGAKEVDQNAMKEKILGVDDPSLISAEIYVQDPDGVYFGPSIQSSGKLSSDFFILPNSIDDSFILSLCAYMNAEVWGTMFPYLGDVVEIDGRQYGMAIPQEKIDMYLPLDIDKTRSYSLFINRLSLNFDGLYSPDGKKAETNHALRAIESLFGGGQDA